MSTLRRWPDPESPELQAWDAADELILDEAGSALVGAEIAVIGDDYGALTLGALDRGARHVRVHQDLVTGDLALKANAAGRDGFSAHGFAPDLAEGVDLVLARLPRSLDELDAIAALVASAGARLIAGARVKHMTTAMNDVLLRNFGRVDVSLARRKARVLTATEPRPTRVPEPRRAHAEGFEVVAVRGVFAGAALDIGTRALLDSLADLSPFDTAVDLGCGTGILAVALARRGGRVIATDRSAAACESARLTAAANSVAVEVQRDDAGSTIPESSVDLVLLNPPFHTGATVDSRVALRLFAAAARMLKPGGELRVVWNSHLRYRPTLERIVGPTRQIARTPKFTVTASTKGS